MDAADQETTMPEQSDVQQAYEWLLSTNRHDGEAAKVVALGLSVDKGKRWHLGHELSKRCQTEDSRHPHGCHCQAVERGLNAAFAKLRLELSAS
jgi:hypothetical protein